MLELELIVLGELLRAGEIDRLTFLHKLDLLAERIAQPALDQINGKVGNVDAEPLPAQLLRRMNGRAATAERVKNYIAGASVRRQAQGWRCRAIASTRFASRSAWISLPLSKFPPNTAISPSRSRRICMLRW